jgi:hypothetical protein
MGGDKDIFSDLRGIEPRLASRNIGSVDTARVTGQSARPIRILPTIELPSADISLFEDQSLIPPSPDPQQLTFTTKGLPSGYGTLDVNLVFCSNPGFLNAGVVPVKLVESGGQDGDNAAAIPGGMRTILSLPVYLESRSTWYSVKPVELDNTGQVELEFLVVGGRAIDCPLSLFAYAPPVTGNQAKRYEVWVMPGCVGEKCNNNVSGYQPEGPESPGGWKIATSGEGKVWAKVCVNQNTGEQTSAEISSGASVPENTDTCFHITIGEYKFEGGDESAPTVRGGGNVRVTICRNWFAASAPFFGVTLTQQPCGGGGESSY